MARFGQVGIALATLGGVLALMGLFPGMTGVEPTAGMGVVQVFLVLAGYMLVILGGVIYVKFTFYAGVMINLIQQIGLRLGMTGLLFAALAGLADIFGFGSHIRGPGSDIYLGWLQAFGMIASFMISALGVLLYAISGRDRIRIDAPEPIPFSQRTATTEMAAVKIETLKPPSPDSTEAAANAAEKPL
jgi:hypothetical protein